MMKLGSKGKGLRCGQQCAVNGSFDVQMHVPFAPSRGCSAVLALLPSYH